MSEALLEEALGLDPASWPELLAGARADAFLAWATHHPRLSVVVRDAWAERGPVCAKPLEGALYVLEALVRARREEGLS